MCIFLNGQEVSKTGIIGFQYLDKNTNTHGFLYQNKLTPNAAGKSCMVLPIPAKANTAKMHDGTIYGKMMDNFLEQVIPVDRAMRSKSVEKALTFEKVGAYDVSIVQGNQLASLYKAIGSDVNQEMVDFMVNHYKDWSFVGCIANDTFNKTTNQPIWITYQSLYPTALYIPLMEAHGTIPQNVDVDRDIAIGLCFNGMIKPYKQCITLEHIPFAKSYPLPNYVFADYFKGMVPNGDLWVDLTEKDIFKSWWDENKTTSHIGFEMPNTILTNLIK